MYKRACLKTSFFGWMWRCAEALKCFQPLPEPKADQGNWESLQARVPFGSQASQPPSFTKIPKQTPEARESPVSGFGWFQAGISPENGSTGLKTRPLHLTGRFLSTSRADLRLALATGGLLGRTARPERRAVFARLARLRDCRTDARRQQRGRRANGLEAVADCAAMGQKQT